MTPTRHGSAIFEFTDRTVTSYRKFDAPSALVYDVLTKTEHVRSWFAADDAPLHVCEIDLRVGGKYHFAWFAPGGFECSFLGTYMELAPPSRLVQTWLFEGWPDDEAIDTVTLTEENGVTIMTDIMEFKTPENLGDHFKVSDGAQSSWDKMEDLLTTLQSGRATIER